MEVIIFGTTNMGDNYKGFKQDTLYFIYLLDLKWIFNAISNRKQTKRWVENINDVFLYERA